MAAMGERFVVQAVSAERFTDPENARLLFLAAGGLALAAVVLLAVTVWWWRSSRVESPALAPLEVMGWHKWSKSTWSERKRLIDEVRPDDSLALSDAPVPPVEIDLRSLLAATPESFDDLREGYEAPVPDAAPGAPEPAAEADGEPDSEADGDGDGDAGLVADEDPSEQLDLGLASMVHRLEFIVDGHIDPDDGDPDDEDGAGDGAGDGADVGEQLAMTLDPLLRPTN